MASTESAAERRLRAARVAAAMRAAEARAQQRVRSEAAARAAWMRDWQRRVALVEREVVEVWR